MENKSNFFKDYAKCVVANKFTLAGYTSLGLSSLLYYIDSNFYERGIVIFFQAGMIGLWGTAFGLETYGAYKKTKKHIQKYNSIDIRFRNKLMSYCQREGAALAVREDGLECLLTGDQHEK